MNAYEDELYRLVDLFCTADQIKELLRSAKGQKDVRITAENKQELVTRNLRTAVGSRALSVGQVYDLVRNAEENGNQHFFYYKPRNKDIASSLTYESEANGSGARVGRRRSHLSPTLVSKKTVLFMEISVF